MEHDDYAKLLDFRNMYQAYRRAARGKHDKAEVIEFELDLARNLWGIIDELRAYRYHVGGYRTFRVFDPKERDIQALSFRDRVVQHCICDNVLGPYLEPRLIYDNAACREGKGTHFAMGRLSGFLREHYRSHGTEGYLLKYDIHHYFDSIDHEVLKCMLLGMPDTEVILLLADIIDSYSSHTSPVTGSACGLPIGNQTSQWFALYYLDPLDRLIKERLRVRGYVRYMDDGVLVHHSKEFLREALHEMQHEVAARGLAFNAKTQVFPLSQGVDFLGFHFYLTDTGKVVRRLRTSSKRRWRGRLKRLQEGYREGEIEAEEVMRSIASYQSHLVHGHTYGLRQKVMGDFVLTRAPHSTPPAAAAWPRSRDEWSLPPL